MLAVVCVLAVGLLTTPVSAGLPSTIGGWSGRTGTIGGRVKNTPTACLALDGDNIRNGWYVEIEADTVTNYCCLDRGVYNTGSEVCTVGCKFRVRAAGDFVNGATECYSNCYDTLGDLTLASSFFTTPLFASNGIVGGPAVTFLSNNFTASQPTTPTSSYIVTKTSANAGQSPGTNVSAYGINTGYYDSGQSGGIDVFCTRKGIYTADGVCQDSCGNTAAASGEYALAGPVGSGDCYYDCYIPLGPCVLDNSLVVDLIDVVSCWAIIKNAAAGWTGFMYYTLVVGTLTAPAYVPKPAQQTCSLTLENGVASLVTGTCDSCSAVCAQLNTYENVLDCTHSNCA